MNLIKLMCTVVLLISIFCSCAHVIKVNVVAIEKLKLDGVENCEINKICDFKHLVYEEHKATITEKEIEECITTELEQYQKLIEITNRDIVKKGDYITISYISKCGNQIVDKSNNKPLRVGAGNFDLKLEQHMVGAKKNKKIIVKTIIPNDIDKKELAGKEEITEIEITKISKLIKPKITNKWIQKNYGYNSVEQFYASIEKNQLEQKQAIEKLNARERVLSNVIDKCTFALDDKEVLEYAKKLYYEAEISANSYGTTIEEFVNDFYNMELKDYYQYCYDTAETDIKKVLFVGVCAEKYCILLDEEQINEYFIENNLKKGEISNEDYVEFKYEILKENVTDYIINTFCN